MKIHAIQKIHSSDLFGDLQVFATLFGDYDNWDFTWGSNNMSLISSDVFQEAIEEMKEHYDEDSLDLANFQQFQDDIETVCHRMERMGMIMDDDGLRTNPDIYIDLEN